MRKNALSMAEPQQKLRELDKHMPDQQEIVYRFASFLANRLGDQEIVPQDFVMGCELALTDLQAGVDGFSGKPLVSKLVGYPSVTYAQLSVMIPMIAEAVFPKDFAAEVTKFFEQV